MIPLYRTALIIPLAYLGGLVTPASAADWITKPSFYTHEPSAGRRVHQYSPIGPVYVFQRSDYSSSGYRHTRSSIEAGGSADHLHVVEEWGRPVRPYEEWRFPYRPYSAPYPLWGAPFAGLGGGGPGFGPGYGYGYQGGPGFPGAAGAPYANGPQPWHDGHYPTYDRHDRAPYYFPYRGRYDSSNGFGGADGSTGTQQP